MIEASVAIRTPDGEMPAFVCRPEFRQAKAVVVMLMDGRGMREALRDNARRLASVGYYILLPNLYYRSGADVEDVPDDLETMRAYAAPLTRQSAPLDVAACLDFAASDPAAAASSPIGLIGYCMGGRLAVVAAQGLGSRITAVASLHPGSMATRSPDSPHLHLDRISAEIYFGVPEHDPYLSPGAVGRLTEALDAAGANYDLEVLAGAQHGYSTPGNDGYSKPAAERAWERTLELFDRRLRA
ncbi:MAG: dienelactone hydrolase family protein [Caulobacteraceae bacterium]|nr:dienelactone hydrolase family protein [Caulobacteraceae bacterium]